MSQQQSSPMDILGFATKLNAGKHHSINNDDVFIDRLNHRYTVSMILVFAAIVTTQQYFGSPITCWVPAQFTGGYEKYANDICWIMNTYYVPMDHDIPHAETTRYERKYCFVLFLVVLSVIILGMLKYYQWSPFILLFMALCFYFPRMIWRSLNNKSGLDIDKLVEAALKQEKQADHQEEREKTIEYITNSIRVYIENRYTGITHATNRPKTAIQRFAYSLTFWRHRHLGSFIFLLFTFVKFLFFMNSLIQIFLLNAFLGNDYHLFGIEVISKFLRGLDWGESKRFPRVTLCDFHIREIGIIHRYTVQCVLPINLFNEKIFLILWFWILLLTAFNAGDFIAWILRIIRVDSRSAYVERKLALKHSKMLANGPHDGERRRAFIHDYLQQDGCFALRLLARNGQDIIVGDIIDRLYRHFTTIYENQHENTDHQITVNPSHPYKPSKPRVPPRSGQYDTSTNEDQVPFTSNPNI